MAQLMLGNIDEGATDEEIRAFLEKYGFPALPEDRARARRRFPPRRLRDLRGRGRRRPSTC
jgi:hypothetical protein